jgi:hypothetical protein
MNLTPWARVQGAHQQTAHRCPGWRDGWRGWLGRVKHTGMPVVRAKTETGSGMNDARSNVEVAGR